jgi:hypothetical protein
MTGTIAFRRCKFASDKYVDHSHSISFTRARDTTPSLKDELAHSPRVKGRLTFKSPLFVSAVTRIMSSPHKLKSIQR